MLQPVRIEPLADRRLITIDLIGDLDADLGATLAVTLDTLANGAECDVLVNFKRVVGIDGAGLAAAARAIAQKRFAGWSVSASVSRRNRAVRNLLASSRIPLEDVAASLSNARHILIAHHAR
jgi:ABC-type transporter Mla MlaB component